MKNWIVRIGIICFVCCISCQEEESETIAPTIDNTIPRDSQLAGLMKNVVIHDGSFDNIVDNGNCLSINLPYNILLNGEPLVIDDITDYTFISETDVVEIQFPITITLFDYQELVIENKPQLDILVTSCEIDDVDIECIDFVYPIVFSTFDSRTNQFDTLSVVHDSEMFKFMTDLDSETLISINYPINLTLHNGQNTEALHNNDLLSAIVSVVSACDEDDN